MKKIRPCLLSRFNAGETKTSIQLTAKRLPFGLFAWILSPMDTKSPWKIEDRVAWFLSVCEGPFPLSIAGAMKYRNIGSVTIKALIQRGLVIPESPRVRKPKRLTPRVKAARQEKRDIHGPRIAHLLAKGTYAEHDIRHLARLKTVIQAQQNSPLSPEAMAGKLQLDNANLLLALARNAPSEIHLVQLPGDNHPIKTYTKPSGAVMWANPMSPLNVDEWIKFFEPDTKGASLTDFRSRKLIAIAGELYRFQLKFTATRRHSNPEESGYHLALSITPFEVDCAGRHWMSYYV